MSQCFHTATCVYARTHTHSLSVYCLYVHITHYVVYIHSHTMWCIYTKDTHSLFYGSCLSSQYTLIHTQSLKSSFHMHTRKKHPGENVKFPLKINVTMIFFLKCVYPRASTYQTIFLMQSVLWDYGDLES